LLKVVRSKNGQRLRQRYALLLASVVATSAIACGAADPSVTDESESDVGTTAQDITGGNLFASNIAPWSSVVSFNSGQCTGLKVGSLYYLTANHCGFVNGQFVTISNALDGVSQMHDHSIVQVFDHPTTFLGRVPPKDLTGQWDLALVKVEYDDGIPVHTPSYAVEVVGDTGYFFGYGCDKVNAGHAGQKQWGLSSPTVNSLSYIDVLFRANNQPQLCPGDSGGPFFKVVNGVYRLEGMNRWAYDPPSNASVWNRIYGAGHWLDAVKAGLPGHNDFSNGNQGTFLSKSSNSCLGLSWTQQVCSFLESPDQRFTVMASAGQLQFVGQGNNAGQCLGVNNTLLGTPITHVTCGSSGSYWTTQNPDASGRYRQYKNVWSQRCMHNLSLGSGTGYDLQACANSTDQYWTFSD
jgi:hypothetical protein